MRVTVGDSNLSCVVLAVLKRQLVRFLCLLFYHLVFMYLFIYYSIIYRVIYLFIYAMLSSSFFFSFLNDLFAIKKNP